MADVVADSEAQGIRSSSSRPRCLESAHGLPPAPGSARGRCIVPALPVRAELVAGARRVVVLEDIVDHANVGAIFRSAAAARGGRRARHAAVRGPAVPA